MKEEIINWISGTCHIPPEKVSDLIEVPSNFNVGSYAIPCFSLAKMENLNPMDMAKNMSSSLSISSVKPLSVSHVENVGGYVNIIENRKDVVLEILKDKKDKFSTGKRKRVCIEFSQPNTHKAFHVGHIRGTAIGESLARIFEYEGDEVVRMNYSGDTGMHIAKWIWCYRKFHGDEELRGDEGWIASVYVDAVKRLAEDEGAQVEVDEINRKIEDKSDDEINELWARSRQLSIDSWDKIYRELGTHFDRHYFESEVEALGKKVSLELLERGIARKDDAVFMDLKKFGLGVWVLLRKDGTVLYSAKDVALAERKLEDFVADRYLVGVADEQRLHFEQLCKTLDLMGFEKASVYDFYTFGMVRLPSGKMSSRTGDNILYSDFMEGVKGVARKGLEERGVGGDLDERALRIAVAAIKYSMLKQSANRVIVFDPSKAVSFEGDTGPYLLYSYARASTLLRKVEVRSEKLEVGSVDDVEYKLVKKLGEFGGVVRKAYVELAPNLVANYCYELARYFNEFYHACPVLGGEKEGFRLRVVGRFREVLGKGLDLLGIEKLEEM